ncbi:MAG: Gfo/Idh/MocA family oxidoreductase, partial [Gemmatimonadota bacterium]|nr:Gfo/Idh/MocA family oxidoreductase [Gemmatimonadota bacterium]
MSGSGKGELGVALIGCGDIGALRADAVGRAEGFRLVVACDRDEPRAAAVAAEHGVAAETDAAAAVARPDVDVAIISTPPSSHETLGRIALEAGAHALIEKPLARSSSECRALLDAAAAADRVLATGFNYRFYPSVAKGAEILAEGRIGRLDHIRSYTGYSATEHSHDWLHDPEVMGGGVLRDNGIHLIDLTCWFLGDVASVQGATAGRVWGFEGCEDNGFALIEGTNGAIATLQASWTEWRGYRFRIDLYGTKGCIRISCFPMITDVVWSETTGGRTRCKRWMFPKVHVMERLKSYRWVVLQSFVAELGALREAIAGRDTALATGGDGLVSIEVAER